VPSARRSQRWHTSANPNDPFYWAREAVAYETDFFGGADSGLRSARCYLIDKQDRAIDLYLEDVSGDNGITWEIPHYAAAAERLGRYQAAVACLKLAMPSILGPGWFEEYVARRAELYTNADTIARVTPAQLEGEGLRELIPAIRAMWERRHEIFAYFATLPTTSCHNDFWSPNLFHSTTPRGPETVAVDLAYVGLGPLGHDAANLVGDAIIDSFVSLADAEPLWEAVSRQYKRGLSTVCERALVDEASRVMELTVALKFAWLIPATFQIAGTPEGIAWVTQHHGNASTFFRRRSATLRFIGRFLKRVPELLRTR
jgi:hypothetical protein